MKPGSDDIGQSYFMAQTAIAQLKSAIRMVLSHAGTEGLRNTDIGRLLGIGRGHVRHKGHIPRTLLAMMEDEGVVERDPDTRRWKLRQAADAESPEPEADGPPA